MVFSPGIAGRMLAFLTAGPAAAAAATPFPELTEREREVLDLVAQARDAGLGTDRG